jgi:hypothetical protein
MLIGTSKASISQSGAVLESLNHLTNHESELAAPVVKLPSVKQLKLITLLQNATVENKKVTAAILTLTLGMLGVHRIYLGTAPYIPAVYLFTFGGGFFVLPIIDLVMILTTNDITKFENNNKLLMWTGE